MSVVARTKQSVLHYLFCIYVQNFKKVAHPPPSLPYRRTAPISTVLVLAFEGLMVGEGLQRPAGLPIGMTAAGIHDTHQFHLQPPQPRDPVADFGNSRRRDAVRAAMGCLGCLLQRDQFRDGVKVKAKLPGMGDERQPVQLGIAIAALPPASAAAIGQQTAPLIITGHRP